jgi:hypothetical protein
MRTHPGNNSKMEKGRQSNKKRSPLDYIAILIN